MKNIALKYEVIVFLMRCFAFGCTFGIGGTGQPSFLTSASLAAFNSYAELYLPLCEFPAYLMAHVWCLHMGLKWNKQALNKMMWKNKGRQWIFILLMWQVPTWTSHFWNLGLTVSCASVLGLWNANHINHLCVSDDWSRKNHVFGKRAPEAVPIVPCPPAGLQPSTTISIVKKKTLHHPRPEATEKASQYTPSPENQKRSHNFSHWYQQATRPYMVRMFRLW